MCRLRFGFCGGQSKILGCYGVIVGVVDHRCC